jgi:hypothetical protein
MQQVLPEGIQYSFNLLQQIPAKEKEQFRKAKVY